MWITPINHLFVNMLFAFICADLSCRLSAGTRILLYRKQFYSEDKGRERLDVSTWAVGTISLACRDVYLPC